MEFLDRPSANDDDRLLIGREGGGGEVRIQWRRRGVPVLGQAAFPLIYHRHYVAAGGSLRRYVAGDQPCRGHYRPSTGSGGRQGDSFVGYDNRARGLGRHERWRRRLNTGCTADDANA